MDYLRQGIHLRGYAQKNPKQEYKREAFELFVEMLDRINYEVISILSKFEVKAEQDVEKLEEQRRAEAMKVKMEYEHANVAALPDSNDDAAPEVGGGAPFTRDEPKIGRNDVCPCGSGKKYKQCHGSLS
jgi:preprotein translocase subunit SecA